MGILSAYLVGQILYLVRRKYRTMEKSSTPQPGHSLASSISNSGPVSILAYCLSSILMTVTNKYVLSGFNFNLNFFLLAVQSIVCIVTIGSLKSLGTITYRQFNKEEAKKWSPIAFLLVAMIYTGSKAIQYLSIPVYTIFKNLTIILIAYGEVIWFGGKVTSMALSSFLLMVLSSMIAYYGDNAEVKSQDDAFTLYLGYFWMLINCFASASFVLIMRKRIKLTNFKDFDTMYYNNLLAIPILLISSFVFEDWSAENLAVNFPADNRFPTISAMILSGVSSVGISYCSAWCVRVTSSTTYSMVGALNKLPIALTGLVFFDAVVNFWSVSSIFVGFIAGLVYAIAKQKQQKEQQALPVTMDKPQLGHDSVAHRISNSGPLSILAYCLSSILMTVTNKYVLSGFSFNLNFFLLAVQCFVCIATIGSLKLSGIITYRNFNLDEAKKWSPIAFLLVAMIYTGSKAIQYLSIPVYTIFKNLTIILIAYGEVIWFGGKVTAMALSSFLLMVLSSIIAYYGDNVEVKTETDAFSLYRGYIWMFINCFASASFVLIMRKRIKLTNFKDFDTMYYNNLLAIPILLISSILLENWTPENLEINFPSNNRGTTIAAMIISGVSSVGISYCSAWCVRVTSSTTYSMVGALNKLPIALTGLVFFDAAVNIWSVSSIFVGFAAGLVYAVAKQNQQKEEKKHTLPSHNK
ncbi:GDP-mannose transporter [Spathaspora sp. JA1]|nr:GDP-mannose transporter [Spathaspora sp. JA1]